MNQKRQPKGTNTGGQFAPDVNAESTLALTPETPAKPEKGKQVYFTVFYDEVTRTWSEDPEYMREGQHIYDNARNNGNWEPVGEHEELSQEAFASLKAKLFGAAPEPSQFDSEIAEHEAAIVATQKEYEDSYEDADYDDLIDLKTGIIEHYEEIARLQRMKLEAQRVEFEQFAAESSFDLEDAIAARVVDNVVGEAIITDVEEEKIQSAVREYFKDDPTNIFENGLGQLLDREADTFVTRQRSQLAEIIGTDIL
jgi:hypothetical protein